MLYFLTFTIAVVGTNSSNESIHGEYDIQIRLLSENEKGAQKEASNILKVYSNDGKYFEPFLNDAGSPFDHKKDDFEILNKDLVEKTPDRKIACA